MSATLSAIAALSSYLIATCSRSQSVNENVMSVVDMTTGVTVYVTDSAIETAYIKDSRESTLPTTILLQQRQEKLQALVGDQPAQDEFTYTSPEPEFSTDPNAVGNPDREFPVHELAQMNQYVVTQDNGHLPSGWQVNEVHSTSLHGSNYAVHTFTNEATKQVVVAVSDGNASSIPTTIPDLRNYATEYTDRLNLYNKFDFPHDYMNNIRPVVNNLEKELHEQGYELIATGYGPDARTAEMLSADLQIPAITFESPGTRASSHRWSTMPIRRRSSPIRHRQTHITRLANKPERSMRFRGGAIDMPSSIKIDSPQGLRESFFDYSQQVHQHPQYSSEHRLGE